MGGTARRAALVTAVVVASLAVVPVRAEAVSTGRPTAVAVAPDGTSYVGFADSPTVLVLGRDGRPAGAVELPGTGALTALAVDPAGDLWADDGATVTRVHGGTTTQFAHRPACAAGSAQDPARRGGLAVTATRVYVAGRCAATLGVYTRTGRLLATVDLPGSGVPRGVAVAPAYRGVPARVYVPGAAAVYGYDASGLAGGARPAVTIRLPRPSGYAAPVAGGVAADDRGHVAVLDVANNALHLHDARLGYRLYRTLGHPPRAAATKGSLDAPAALAQGTAGTGRDLWVADTGNGRVQRWNTVGTTRWMVDTIAPSVDGAPVNVSAPAVTGAPALGAELGCNPGSWSPAATSYAWVWKRDGVPVAGATASTYVVTAADAGAGLSCVVSATNEVGTGAPASSAEVTVPGGDPTPVSTCRGRSTVLVDGEHRYARDRYVTLSIRAPRGATEVVISNDGFRHSDRRPLVASCRYAWTLAGAASRRAKVVSVRFPGVPGTARDRIVLDDADPVIRRVSAQWVDARGGWVLDVDAHDRGAGIARVRVGKTHAEARSWRWPADIVSWDSSQLRWIQVVDRSGRRSDWYRLRL